MEFLTSLSGCELVTLASLLAVILSKELTPEEIDVLGNFLSAIGSNLSTIAIATADEVLE